MQTASSTTAVGLEAILSMAPSSSGIAYLLLCAVHTAHIYEALCNPLTCICHAVVAPSSPKATAQAAASLVEAGTSGEGQEHLDSNGEKKKKTRKKKDPAAPKKALTTYLVYINGKRPQVVREHPEADLKDQVGVCSAALSAP